MEMMEKSESRGTNTTNNKGTKDIPNIALTLTQPILMGFNSRSERFWV